MAKSNSTQLLGRAKDEASNSYGRLTVIEFGDVAGTEIRWLCRCECGKLVTVRGASLRSGHTASCGCLSRSANGLSVTPEYRIWYAMNNRCHNPKASHYAYYGGRGIIVCERWRKSFDAFLEDMGPKPFSGATIDRIDNMHGYEPSNCKWSTRKEQSLNTRTTKMLTYNGETMCQSDWARKLGIAYQTLNYRLKQGWPEDRAFSPKESH